MDNELDKVDQTMMRKLSNSRGYTKAFTLVELLVVISIIALLMSILMPALQKVKRQAKAVVCLSNLRQMTLAFMFYTENNNNEVFKYDWRPNSFWMESLREYYGEIDQMRFCPSAKKNDPVNEYGDSFWAWGPFQDKAGSYGFNSWLHPVTSDMEYGARIYGQDYGGGEDAYFGSVTQPQTYNIPVIFDCKYLNTWPLDTDLAPVWDDRITGFSGSPRPLGTMARVAMPRHGWAVNLSFLDGSVRKVSLEGLWKLKWHKQFKPIDIDIPKP